MANAGDVIFAIKTIWEGSAAFSEASKSAQKTKEKVDELGDSIRSASDQTKSMFKAFLGASAVQKGFSMLTNAVSGFINQSETMYKDHNVALTQLTNTMRNSMSASDAEIESILKLTEAQTKLGVVSTEVQLSGAKELSSYLQKKESLEKLIPVMNDMLAYQYGLSATQEQAANITMLLGRVLDGQTGALSRNGYRFSEAQKEVLEYGNESERVAMLAEVISQTVEGVNESLAATPEGKVKQIANEYGHVQVEIGKLVTKIRGEATAVFKQVVVKLWENRNTILQVVKAVGVLTAGVVAYKVGVAAANVVGKVWNGLMKAKTVAMSLYTGSVKAATLATNLFNKASKANIIGAIVGVLSTAISAFSLFKKNVNNAADASRGFKRAVHEANGEIQKQQGEMNRLFEQLKKNNITQNERIGVIKKINEAYGEYLPRLITERDTIEEIEKLQRSANNELAKKILITTKEERIKEELSLVHDGMAATMHSVYDLIKTINSEEGTDTFTDSRQALTNYIKDLREFGYGDEMALRAAIYKGENPNVKSFGGGSVESDKLSIYLKNLDDLVKREQEITDEVSAQFDAIINSYSSDGAFMGGGGGDSDGNAAKDDALKTADAITAGGKGIRNFYINIDSLIGSTNNYFTSSKDDPASASDFMQKLSNALQLVVNDVNYIAD